MQTERSHREIVTPDAFTVAPHLLGLALARPWRRAAAILLDLAFCGLIVAIWQARTVFFAALAAFIVFNVTRRQKQQAGRFMRAVGVSLRSTLAFITFAIALAFTNMFGPKGPGEGALEDKTAGRGMVEMSLGPAGLTLAEGMALFRASTPEQADVVAARIRDRLLAAGLSAEDARAIRDGLAEARVEGTPLNPIAIDALSRAFAAFDTLPEPAEAALDADSLALAYSAALTAGDSVAADTIRPALAEVLAADRIEELERRNRRLDRRVRQLEETQKELEKAGRARGLTGVLHAAITEDLGLGFGWLALYFTAFTVGWRGYTPGKRLFGIRVIRLDGEPLTTWQCFERFGGYSASLATGLLGFAQILWDKNRQAIHDKIVSTVVIDARAVRRSASEKPTRGAESAPDGALDRRRDEVVAGKGDPGGEPVGVEGGEMP